MTAILANPKNFQFSGNGEGLTNWLTDRLTPPLLRYLALVFFWTRTLLCSLLCCLLYHPCALLCAYPEPQLIRNGRVVPPLLSQNCCIRDSPRLHSAASAMPLRLRFYIESFTLGRSHRHSAGDPGICAFGAC